MSLLTQWQEVPKKITRANYISSKIWEHEPLYTELQYLTMDGGQWITPGLSVNSNYIVEVKYLLTGSSKGMGRLFGSSADMNFEMAANNTGQFRWSINKGYSAMVNFTSGVAHIFKCYGTGQCYIDDELKSNLNASQNSVTFYLFSEYSHTEQAKGNFYYCKIWNGSTLVRDYIPAKDPDGVVCLYDVLNDRYYYNGGTGSFIAGPVKA